MGSLSTARVRSFWQGALSLLLMVSVLLISLTLHPTSFASASGAMSCCPAGSSDHCSSGLAAVEPEPEPESACGHEVAGKVEEETIKAEPNDEEPPQDISADEATDQTSFLIAPCAVDCCSFACGSFKRPNRDVRGLLSRKTDTQSFNRRSQPHISLVLPSAPQRFNRATPRGPPPS